MTTPSQQFNSNPNQEVPEDITVNPDPVPADGDTVPIDDAEVAAADTTPSPPAEPNWQTEADPETDPLDGFSPDNFKDGVEGDERYRILDLYVGYLAGTDLKIDPIKLRHAVVKWDDHNRPPLGVMEIHAYIKANLDKWLRHHYLHKTGTWTPRG